MGSSPAARSWSAPLRACGKSRGPVIRDESTRLDGVNRPASQPKGLDFATLRSIAMCLTASVSEALSNSDFCHRLLRRRGDAHRGYPVARWGVASSGGDFVTAAVPHAPGRRSLPLGRRWGTASRSLQRPAGAASLRSTDPPLQGPIRRSFNGIPPPRWPPWRAAAPGRSRLAPIAEFRASGSVQHVP